MRVALWVWRDRCWEFRSRSDASSTSVAAATVLMRMEGPWVRWDQVPVTCSHTRAGVAVVLVRRHG